MKKKFTVEMSVEKIAELAYEQDVTLGRMLENYNKPSWKDASDAAKESAINHTKFLLENPNSTPDAAHNDWLKRKEADGWTYGEKFDLEKKTDPGIVPYLQRSAAHNAKAYLFRRVVEIFTSSE